jgi:type III secretory pathway component EscS
LSGSSPKTVPIALVLGGIAVLIASTTANNDQTLKWTLVLLGVCFVLMGFVGWIWLWNKFYYHRQWDTHRVLEKPEPLKR